MTLPPYPARAMPQTHPRSLAVIARLHGLDPAPPDACRVLDIGCADGINITAMAATARGLTAVGIDIDEAAVASGQEFIGALGLADRVDLRLGDLTAAGDLGGPFDYVIAHGVYAWTPPAVRDALLACIRVSLAPHGVGYVSYATHPKGHHRRVLVDAASGELRTLRAVAALAAGWADRDTTYGAFLAEEAERIIAKDDLALAHNELAPALEPVWFGEFAAHAASHGLAYLAGARPWELGGERFPPGLHDELRAMTDGDRIAVEHLGDLIAGRTLRESLVCRDDAGALEHPDPSLTAGMVATPANSGTCLDVTSQGDVRSRHVPSEEAEDAFAAYTREELALHLTPPPAVATTPPQRPLATALARAEAARGTYVTNLRHEPVAVEDAGARFLLALCDGTRDAAALGRELGGAPADRVAALLAQFTAAGLFASASAA